MQTNSDEDTRIRTLSQEVPGYEVLGLLGQGGMGSVYLVKHQALRGTRVLKKIRSGSNETELAERLRDEARIIADFRHPNIVLVHNSFAVKDVHYIEMEYVDGGTLHSRIVEQGSLPEAEAAQIALAVANALAYSHERGVIHRDVKPKNILMRKDGTAVLSDFGIAKSMTSDDTDKGTQTGFVVGDRPYVAPERMAGIVAAGWEDRVDVYSFGLVFHEMLLGRRPLPGELTEADKPVQALDRFPRYRALIRACLHWDPKQRPSAADCARQLLSAINANSPSVRSPKRRWIALTALFVALLGSASYATYLNLRPYTLEISPSQATVYVDGVKLHGTTIPNDGKAHEVAVISAGHVGQLLPLDRDMTRIALEPLNTPTPTEYQAFEAQYIGKPSTERVTHAPFKALLRLKQLEDQGLTAKLSKEWQNISSLAELGDQSASVVEFLKIAKNQEAGTPIAEAVLTHLELAMQRGYPFATCLYLAYLEDRGLRDTSEYRKAVELAEQQGLDPLFYKNP